LTVSTYRKLGLREVPTIPDFGRMTAGLGQSLFGFRPPDRTMSATDARVGARLAQGMNITEATREGDSETNKMVDRDEDYNTRYGGYAGNLLAFKRTKLIPRHPAAIDLTAMIQAAHADTADKVVDHFIHRFFRLSLAEKDRAVLVDFFRGKLGTSRVQPSETLESSLRELLYLVLSTPEYQLG
jgi:hypothetical protein